MNDLRRRRAIGDDGLGMIMVIGISGVVFVLAFTAVAYALNGLTQSRARTSFELSLATAESGVDRTLGKLQNAFTAYNVDYPVPNTPTASEPSPWCSATPFDWPATGNGAQGRFTDEDSEREWARARLNEIRLATPACVQRDARGEYVVLKPPSPVVAGAYPKAGTVYSLSAVPSFSDGNAKTRLVKSEYVFMPYRPTHAVLTGGDLALQSSTTVRTAAGVPPSMATVHSNTSVIGGGSPIVTGGITSTGASPSGGFRTGTGSPTMPVGVAPVQRVPRVSAKNFYYQAEAGDPAAISTWYDLCPNGDVLPYGGTAGPCGSTATPIGRATQSNGVLGWEYDASTRLWEATRYLLPGTYYVMEGNVNVANGTGNRSVPKLTVIAQAENAADCASKRYGNITWNLLDVGAPAYRNLWFYSDTDLRTLSNYSAGSGTTVAPVVSGMFIAGDQIDMETSSNGAVGSVVAANQCSSPAVPNPPAQGLVTTSSIKNPTIWYDPNSDAPFTSIITTTLWLDYSG